MKDAGETQHPKTADYDAVFDRVFAETVRYEQTLAEERRDAPQLLAELRQLPFARQRILVRNSRRYRTWAVCQALIDLSHQLGFRDPQESRDVASLATELADRLDAGHYGEIQVHDMKGAAWSQYANAVRILSDLRKADDAFSIAEHFLAHGSGDLLARARMYDLKSSLRLAQCRYADAASLLSAAVELYRGIGDPRRQGGALIKLASVRDAADQTEAAIELINEGIKLLDPVADRRLLLTALHNQIAFLSRAGRHLAAQALLAQTRRLHLQFGDEVSLLRWRWLEGHVAFGLGRLQEAERAFTEAQHGFVRHSLGYDAALVSLDLALVFSRQARLGELKQLAVEMLPIFRLHDLHSAAMAALLVFRQALEAERASLTVIHDIRSFLKQARSNPRLRFEGLSSARRND